VNWDGSRSKQGRRRSRGRSRGHALLGGGKEEVGVASVRKKAAQA
jgi:hypothetical protein